MPRSRKVQERMSQPIVKILNSWEISQLHSTYHKREQAAVLYKLYLKLGMSKRSVSEYLLDNGYNFSRRKVEDILRAFVISKDTLRRPEYCSESIWKRVLILMDELGGNYEKMNIFLRTLLSLKPIPLPDVPDEPIETMV
jgi:hypothetical protein